MPLFICLLFIPVQPETIGRYMRLCLLYHLSLCLSGSSSAQIEHSLSHTHTLNTTHTLRSSSVLSLTLARCLFSPPYFTPPCFLPSSSSLPPPPLCVYIVRRTGKDRKQGVGQGDAMRQLHGSMLQLKPPSLLTTAAMEQRIQDEMVQSHWLAGGPWCM